MTLSNIKRDQSDDAVPAPDEIAAHWGWVDLKPSVRERDDVRPILDAMAEARQIQNAAVRIRWALVKKAADFPISRQAHRLLAWILDEIHRTGLIGWRPLAEFGDRLGLDRKMMAKTIASLEEHDLIRITGGHRNRLVWAQSQEKIAVGSRGPSYTFGHAGFESFEALLNGVRINASPAAADVATTATSDRDEVELMSPPERHQKADVATMATSDPLMSPKSRQQEDQRELYQREITDQRELKSANAPSTTTSTPAIEGHEVDLAGSPSEHRAQPQGRSVTVQGSSAASRTTPTPLPPAPTSRVPVPMPGAATDLFGGEGAAVGDVRLPMAISAVVLSGEAPVACQDLAEQIRAARFRGNSAEAVYLSLSRSSASAERWCLDKGRKLTPSRVLQFASGDLVKLEPPSAGSDGQPRRFVRDLDKTIPNAAAVVMSRGRANAILDMADELRRGEKIAVVADFEEVLGDMQRDEKTAPSEELAKRVAQLAARRYAGLASSERGWLNIVALRNEVTKAWPHLPTDVIDRHLANVSAMPELLGLSRYDWDKGSDAQARAIVLETMTAFVRHLQGKQPSKELAELVNAAENDLLSNSYWLEAQLRRLKLPELTKNIGLALKPEHDRLQRSYGTVDFVLEASTVLRRAVAAVCGVDESKLSALEVPAPRVDVRPVQLRPAPDRKPPLPPVAREPAFASSSLSAQVMREAEAIRQQQPLPSIHAREWID